MSHAIPNRSKSQNDQLLFCDDQIPLLAQAVSDLSYLLTRNYAEKSALELVGNRYRLNLRQRMMVLRAACSDQSLSTRRETEVPLAQTKGRSLIVDGLNILITLEQALSGGIVFTGRDSVVRDIAGVHGAYRKGKSTLRAIHQLLGVLSGCQPKEIVFYLDSPVSNSGLVKQLILETAETLKVSLDVHLVNNPDKCLVDCDGVAVTSDGWILDNAKQWTNLIGAMQEKNLIDIPALLRLAEG